MKFKLLGRTGVHVSELCFGTMSFGGDADEAESAKLYKMVRDAGINFFDCANVYSRGAAETILGKLIQGEREQLIITTKVASPTGEDINQRGVSRLHIRQSVEESLKRLGTDHIDVLLTHRWSDDTPLEETLRGLEDLVRHGKVLYLGASNYAAWQIQKGLGISAANNWSRFEVIQPMYNLAKRQAEVEILPMARSEQVGVISYGPVGGGLLSGKYASGKRPDSGRLIDNKTYNARYNQDWIYEVAGKFTAFAREHGMHPVSLAVAWVKAHPGITSPIIGARNVRQLQPSLDALNVEMTATLRDEISALSPTPPLATDRLEEQTV